MSFWIGFFCFITALFSGFVIDLSAALPIKFRRIAFLFGLILSIAAVGNGIFYAIGYSVPEIGNAARFNNFRLKEQGIAYAIILWPYVSVIFGAVGSFIYGVRLRHI